MERVGQGHVVDLGTRPDRFGLTRGLDVVDRLTLLHGKDWPTRRIKEKLDTKLIVGEVFQDPDPFNAVLVELVKGDETQIKLGGRTLRNALGCTTKDYAGSVRSDAFWLDDHKKIRLGNRILRLLLSYPDKRFLEKDLDFFVSGVGVGEISEKFKRKGFDVEMHTATGGVEVLAVNGDHGAATFIDGKESWQTKETWPMIGLQSPLTVSEGQLVVDIGYGRIYVYPLETGLTDLQDPAEPSRFAAVARASLWGLTVFDPFGRPLQLPTIDTQNKMIRSVSQTDRILTGIEQGRLDGRMYAGAMRDLALSAMIAETHIGMFEVVDRSRYEFYGQLRNALLFG